MNAGHTQDSHPPDPSQSHIEHTPRSLPPRPDLEPAEHEEGGINPTFSYRSWFDNRNVFYTPILIGEAADTAFATRFRQVISDPRVPEPSHLLRVNYANNETLMALGESGAAWPSQSRARFLIEASLKYISRCYCIVHPGTVIEQLTQIFLDPTWGGSVLRCKFWALFAIGELYAAKVAFIQGYPGMAYFAQASKMLGFFEERPGMDSIETFLLLACGLSLSLFNLLLIVIKPIYSLALNRRYSAYILSGTAMRSTIITGLHLNISDSQLSDPSAREHRKRLFWSAYIFDRMWGANLGHLAAIQDDEIEIDLPSKKSLSDQAANSDSASDVSDCEYQRASVKLACHFTSVIRSVYSLRRPHQDRQFSTRVHHSLQDLQAWVDQLSPSLQLDKSSEGPNDLKVVSLHLSFHQVCIYLVPPSLHLHLDPSTHSSAVRDSRNPSNSTTHVAGPGCGLAGR